MYQLGKPAATLAPYLEHYWFVTARAEDPLDLTVDVYVDARADLIFNLGAPYTRTVLGAAHELQRASNLDAQRSRPIKIAQRGAVIIAGARFHTAGLAPFTPTPVHRFTDRVVPVEEVFGPDAVVLEGALRATIADAAAQTRLLDDFFQRRLRRTPALAQVHTLKSRIEAEDGLIRVDELCRTSGVSIRQLGRLFRDHLGFSPKMFARIVRFQRALTLLKRDPGCTLAEIAARCGYYDQPHFVRDFKAFAGAVPRAQTGYFPAEAPADFSPNLVQFLQDPRPDQGDPSPAQ